MIHIVARITAAWLLADFIAGMVHWIEDRYLSGMLSIDFFRRIHDDNAQHHQKPTALLLHSYWENIRGSVAVAWPGAALLWFAGAPAWLYLALFFTAFGNLIHRFSHTPQKQLPRGVNYLQRLGLFITHEQHASHHYAMGHRVNRVDATRAYCPMTSFLNPILDHRFVRFWDRAETCLLTIGIPPQPRTINSTPP